ncbi:MAG: hypothetical protein MR911_08980 [Spirochaetia bacterium]|nr:hypothetical protein [Treponema sp.]MCI6366613.1 hypothetical protein [Spirochaetia bacterium]MDY2826012.1 hypothetical protein [Treponema sp.]
MNRILSALRDNISNIGKIILLVIFCIFIGLIISYPLWKFATVSPELYTIICLFLIGLLILFFTIKFIRKNTIKKNIRFFLKVIIFLAGISGSIMLVLSEHRFFALLCFLMMLILFFICNLCLYEKEAD